MSTTSDIKPVLTTDARISDIKNQLDVSALVASRDNSFYEFSATTASANSVNVTCNLPSESVCFDRSVFLSAIVNFTLKITIPKAGTNAPAEDTPMFPYGKACSFQQFPLNGMISNNNCKVNSVSFNMSQDDLQTVLLKTQDLNDLVRSNMCMSPSYPDQFLQYSSGQAAYTNNPMNGYLENHFSSLVSRGSHPIFNTKFTVLKPDGSVQVAEHTNPAAFISLDPAVEKYTYVANFSAQFYEPLLLSPFIFCSKKVSKAGMVHVQNLVYNFTLDPILRNVWSRLPFAGAIEGVSGFNYELQLQSKPFDKFSVCINCLTPHITQSLPSISILPCHTWERYTSSAVNTTAFPAYPDAKSSGDVILNNLVLSQIPELIIIVVRKPMSSQSYNDSKAFLKINTCSINFLNAQGMLSNCDDHALFKISKENGYSDNWYQWSGLANSSVSASGGYYNKTIYTTGSVLIINPAKDLSIGSPYLTNGSRGSYNLQLKLNVTNYYNVPITPEVMIACKYGCYLKNYVGGKSTLTSGFFDMSMLSSIVTGESELSNADLVEKQGNSISDQSIGEVEPASNYEGAGYRRPRMSGRGGHFGGSLPSDKRCVKSKICL